MACCLEKNCWQTKLAALIRIPLEAEFFSTVNGIPLHAAVINTIQSARYD